MAVDLRVLATHAAGIAVGYADAHTVEVGAPNSGEQVEWFQHAAGGTKGESWCADFIYACFLKADSQSKGLLTGATNHDNRVIMLAHADAFETATHIPRTGYCPTVAIAAEKQGRFHGKNFTPSPGDLVLFDFKSEGEPHHIGFVLGVLAGGTLSTVEGNTSVSAVGSQANGGGVYKRTRSLAKVYGFVHFG